MYFKQSMRERTSFFRTFQLVEAISKDGPFFSAEGQLEVVDIMVPPW